MLYPTGVGGVGAAELQDNTAPVEVMLVEVSPVGVGQLVAHGLVVKATNADHALKIPFPQLVRTWNS